MTEVMAAEIEKLIERLEKLTGPDREVDLAIYLALNPESEIARIVNTHPRVAEKEHREGYSWHISGDCVICQKREGRNLPYTGGIPLPYFTGLLDHAKTLVPPDHGWFIENTTLTHIAQVYRLIDIDLPAKRFDGDHDIDATALTIAALRALSHKGDRNDFTS